VVERLAAPLATALGPQLSTWLLDLHLEHGVHVHLGVEVEAFAGHGHVEEVVLTDGRRLPAQTVVVGVGVEPQVDLARRAGSSIGTARCDTVPRSARPWRVGRLRIPRSLTSGLSSTAVSCRVMAVTVPVMTS
jgi:3-phenylpropionate/trans-cinnamate dioxygenase ferredoxin reductase component